MLLSLTLDIPLCLKHQDTETSWFDLYLSQANTGTRKISAGTRISEKCKYIQMQSWIKLFFPFIQFFPELFERLLGCNPKVRCHPVRKNENACENPSILWTSWWIYLDIGTQKCNKSKRTDPSDYKTLCPMLLSSLQTFPLNELVKSLTARGRVCVCKASVQG